MGTRKTDYHPVYSGEEYLSSDELFAAIKIVARSFHEAPIESLAVTHLQVYEYLMDIIESTPRGDLSNATEQRVLGSIWAELEEAIDQRTVAANKKNALNKKNRKK